MMATEKQAAAAMRRTLNSCKKKILDSAGKYGGDWRYLESVMEDVVDAIDRASANMEAE